MAPVYDCIQLCEKKVHIILSKWVEKTIGVLFCSLAYFSDFKILFLCFKMSEISPGNKNITITIFFQVTEH